MITWRDWTNTNVAWLALLGVALVWVVSAGARAALLEPLPEASPPTTSSLPDLHERRRLAMRTPAVLAAVRANPMRSDRQRGEGRYGQSPAREPAEHQARAPIPAFQVVGVVLRRSGPDLAAIAWDRSPSQLVRLGGEVQGFALNRIRADSIFLARPDTAIGLAVPGRRFRQADR